MAAVLSLCAYEGKLLAEDPNASYRLCSIIDDRLYVIAACEDITVVLDVYQDGEFNCDECLSFNKSYTGERQGISACVWYVREQLICTVNGQNSFLQPFMSIDVVFLRCEVGAIGKLYIFARATTRGPAAHYYYKLIHEYDPTSDVCETVDARGSHVLELLRFGAEPGPGECPSYAPNTTPEFDSFCALKESPTVTVTF